jgi:hypothetical protein
MEIAIAERIKAARKLWDSLVTEMEYNGGIKKYVISSEDRTTAMNPAMTPPNQALPMTAPKKRNTNGYAMTCCNGKVHSSATTTKQSATAHGFRAYSNIP